MKSTIILALASMAIAAPTRTIENRQLPGFGSSTGTGSGLDGLKSLIPGLSGSGSSSSGASSSSGIPSSTSSGSGLGGLESLIPGLSGSGSSSDTSLGSGLDGLKSLIPGLSGSGSSSDSSSLLGRQLSIPGLGNIPYQPTSASETAMLTINF